jgi:poly(3-hydroxybutyrate) depolymerase/lysophospholipase L1-like esterase
MKRFFLLFPVLLFACLFSAQAQDFEARIFTAADGAKLPYRLLKPRNYDPAQKYPLVLFLHGAGERGEDNGSQLKHGAPAFAKAEAREKYPCFVIAPQCPKDRKWVEMDWGGPSGIAPADAGPMQALTLACVDAIAKEFSVDQDRLYVTGLSMGGYGTWDLITRFPAKWAAAAPVCGGGDKSKAPLAKPVPVWAFHGTADHTVLPIRSQDMVAALKGTGAAAVLTEYPGVGHDSWTLAYSEPNLLPWLFAQRRGQPAQRMELATSAYLAVALPAANEVPGQGALQVGDWFQKLWMQRREEFSRAREREQGAVVFLGDSITQGWANLAKDFPGFKTANRGISGDTTRGVLFRLKGDVLDVHPKAVSLLIGTNDLDLGTEPDVVFANIKAIVETLQKHDAAMPVIVNRVMPRGPKPGKFPEKIQTLNGLIDAFAKENGKILVCDAWSIFDDGTGSCKKAEFPDLLHPNSLGYAKWKTALDEIFARLKL